MKIFKSKLNIAYLFQAVNFIVTISMLPIILNFINSYQYAVWSIFLTIFGFTLQIQNAIQNFVIREMSGSYQNNSIVQFENSWALTKKLYKRLSLIVALPIYFGGIYYLFKIELFDRNIFLSFTILTFGYIGTYMFAPLNAILLATDRSNVNNNINILTRLLYLFISIFLLNIDGNIFFLSSAFLFSVAVGSVILLKFVDLEIVGNRIRQFDDSDTTRQPLHFRNFYLYGLYSFCSFFLYSGTILVAGMIFQPDVVASYSLGIQIGAMLSAVALTPLPVWLAKQMDAIVSNNASEQLFQLTKTISAVNLVFLVGSAIAIVFVGGVVSYINDNISAISSPYFFIILFSFGIEANIFVFANFCAAHSDYKYVKTYALIACPTAIAGCSAAVYYESLLPLILFPAIGQSLVSLPVMLFRTGELLGLTPQSLLWQMARAVGMKFRGMR